MSLRPCLLACHCVGSPFPPLLLGNPCSVCKKRRPCSDFNVSQFEECHICQRRRCTCASSSVASPPSRTTKPFSSRKGSSGDEAMACSSLVDCGHLTSGYMNASGYLAMNGNRITEPPGEVQQGHRACLLCHFSASPERLLGIYPTLLHEVYRVSSAAVPFRPTFPQNCPRDHSFRRA